MKITDIRKKKQKPLTLSDVPIKMVFEFVDKSNAACRSVYLRVYMATAYTETHDGREWCVDLIKAKTCLFNNTRKVRLLEAEFHIIGELGR